MDGIALIRFGNQIAERSIFASKIFVRQISDSFKVQILENLMQSITQVGSAGVISDIYNRSAPVVICTGLHQYRSIVNQDTRRSLSRFNKVFAVSAASINRDLFVVNEIFAGFKYSLLRSQA